MNLKRLFHSLLVVAASVGTAHAGTWDYFAAYQLDYSDNILRDVLATESGFFQTLSAGIGYAENSTRLVANVDASVEYVNFFQNDLDDETWLFVDADLRWALVRNRLFWVLTDILTNEPINSRQPNVPTNLQQTNVFTTGPSLVYEFDGPDRIQADLRYINSYAEVRDSFNADRWLLTGNWMHGISTTTDLGLGAGYYDVSFDNAGVEGIENYQGASVFGILERRLQDSTFHLEAGFINVDFDGSDSESGWRGLVEWRRVISSSSEFVLDFRHGLTDASLDFSSATDPVSVGERVISGRVYTATGLDLLYLMNWTASTVSVSAAWERQDYVDVFDEDRDEMNLLLSWTRNFRGGWLTSLSGRVRRTEYVGGRTDDTYYIDAGVIYTSTRHLTYELNAHWEDRESNREASNYDETGIFFLVRYAR